MDTKTTIEEIEENSRLTVSKFPDREEYEVQQDGAFVGYYDEEELLELRDKILKDRPLEGDPFKAELQHVTDVLSVAEKHGLRTEAMASYARARADGKPPDEAAAIAHRSWDL